MGDSNLSQLIVHTSVHSSSQVVESLKKLFQTKGITLFASIDHAGEAHKAGLELPYEQLLIFGDPKTGTLLMQENPAIGIELPLKILVWQDKEGSTKIVYKDPTYFAPIYGITKHAGILQKMKEALAGMVVDAVKRQ